MTSSVFFENCYLVNENTLAVALVRWWFVLLLLEWEVSIIKSGGFVGLEKRDEKIIKSENNDILFSNTRTNWTN